MSEFENFFQQEKTIRDSVKLAMDRLRRNKQIRESAEKWIRDPGDGKPIEIICQFGTWAVTTYGLECVDGENFYPIMMGGELDSAVIEGQLRHVMEKNWVDRSDFAQALLAASQIHGFLRKERQS